MSILASFAKILVFLQTLKDELIIKDYSLVGGLALSAWIEPRTTRDVDLVISVAPGLVFSDLKSIVENRLEKRTHQPTMTAMTQIREMFTYAEGDMQVDMISAGGFALAEEALDNAVVVTVLGRHVKVATPEYLIALKLLPFEDQDLVDIKRLLNIADVEKVREIAGRHMLTPGLEKVLKSLPGGSG